MTDTHQSNLTRVRDAIAKHVITFLDRHLNKEFHAVDLHNFVAERVMISPGSADRVMRDLKKKGMANYELVSRGKSLYRALPVGQMRLF